MVSTFLHALPSGTSSGLTKLDPHYAYLRVVSQGRTVLLAQGNWEDHHRVSVWYSGTGEVVRLNDGRLVGATGLFTEWRDVRLPPLPSWSVLASSSASYHWLRERDVMPGYHYGIQDHLTLQRVGVPAHSDLTGVVAQTLVWFKETDDRLPPAWYAWDSRTQQVIYGRVCLDPSLCFSWQRWPVS